MGWDAVTGSDRRTPTSRDGLDSFPMRSGVRLFLTPWTVARQSPLSMGFSRQEHWSGLPFPTPGDLLDLGTEPESPEAPPALAGLFFTTEPPGKPPDFLRSSKGKVRWQHAWGHPQALSP